MVWWLRICCILSHKRSIYSLSVSPVPVKNGVCIVPGSGNVPDVWKISIDHSEHVPGTRIGSCFLVSGLDLIVTVISPLQLTYPIIQWRFAQHQAAALAYHVSPGFICDTKPDSSGIISAAKCCQVFIKVFLNCWNPFHCLSNDKDQSYLYLLLSSVQALLQYFDLRPYWSCIGGPTSVVATSVIIP